MSDLRTFTANIDRFQERLAKRSRLLVRGVAVTLSNEIVSGGRYSQGTPIDQGYHRDSWAASSNGDLQGASGQGSPAAVEAVALALEPGDPFGLANNGPAIRRLEFGFHGPDSLGRVYDQEGKHFVRDALDHFQPIVDEVAVHLQGNG